MSGYGLCVRRGTQLPLRRALSTAGWTLVPPARSFRRRFHCGVAAARGYRRFGSVADQMNSGGRHASCTPLLLPPPPTAHRPPPHFREVLSHSRTNRDTRCLCLCWAQGGGKRQQLPRARYRNAGLVLIFFLTYDRSRCRARRGRAAVCRVLRKAVGAPEVRAQAPAPDLAHPRHRLRCHMAMARRTVRVGVFFLNFHRCISLRPAPAPTSPYACNGATDFSPPVWLIGSCGIGAQCIVLSAGGRGGEF